MPRREFPGEQETMVSAERLDEILGDVRLGTDELHDFAQALSVPPRAAIRISRNALSEPLPFETRPVPWHPHGRIVLGDTRPGSHLEFAAGMYYVQDAGSLLALSLLDARPGEWICDLCASPGGKSTAILDALEGQGWLLCNEAVHSRLGPLEFNLAKYGHVRYVLAQLDPADLARRLGGIFDAVLVDAPCSGQSLVSRGKQTESSFSDQTIQHCAARQSRILQSAAQLVRPGGRLVYSTCTMAFAENEGRVASFLASDRQWDWSPSERLAPWRSEFGEACYRIWPHRHECGGAFAARIVRDASEPRGGRADVESRDAALRSASRPDDLDAWGDLKPAVFYRVGARSFAWPPDLDARLLTVGVAGPELCFRKGATWFPSFALAMRQDPGWKPRQVLPLPREHAVRYVQGHTLPGDAHSWCVATWRDRPLGWLKGDGIRLKNHLPKAGRGT